MNKTLRRRAQRQAGVPSRRSAVGRLLRFLHVDGSQHNQGTSEREASLKFGARAFREAVRREWVEMRDGAYRLTPFGYIILIMMAERERAS